MLFQPYTLWPDPCVIAYQRDDARYLELLLAQAPEGASILCHCPCHDGRPFFAHVANLQDAYRHVRIHLMANTRLELREYQEAFSLPASYGPVALFTNERVFDVAPNRAKDHAAIYVARFQPGVRGHVKRLPLAAKVDSLRVVTFSLGRRHGFREPFYATFPELRHAEVNNEMLLPLQVASAMQSAHVQLALSRQEGCMLAFTEALLCGVPGVSTPCRSARTEFFNEMDVLVCDDEPSAVAQAVSTMSARKLDPATVRARALERLREMRREYVAYLRTLTGVAEDVLMEHLFGHSGGAQHLSFSLPTLPERANRATSQALRRGAWPGVYRQRHRRGP